MGYRAVAGVAATLAGLARPHPGKRDYSTFSLNPLRELAHTERYVMHLLCGSLGCEG